MKKWIALALAVGFLIGLGVLLFSPRQSPLAPDSEKAEPLASGETAKPTSTATDAPTETPTADEGHGPEAREAPRGIDPLEGKRLSAEEFRVLGAKVAKELPTKNSVQGLTDKDVHTTPKPMMEAGQQLGLIAQAVSNEPALARDAFGFYEKCAGSDGYLDAVRALCYSNYKDLGAKLGLPLREEIAPAKIRELAEKIQGL